MYFQDGKNHVTFPEFQQNGSAKQFTHGKKKYYRLGTYFNSLLITSVDRMHVWVQVFIFISFRFLFRFIIFLISQSTSFVIN